MLSKTSRERGEGLSEVKGKVAKEVVGASLS